MSGSGSVVTKGIAINMLFFGPGAPQISCDSHLYIYELVYYGERVPLILDLQNRERNTACDCPTDCHNPDKVCLDAI